MHRAIPAFQLDGNPLAVRRPVGGAKVLDVFVAVKDSRSRSVRACLDNPQVKAVGLVVIPCVRDLMAVVSHDRILGKILRLCPRPLVREPAIAAGRQIAHGQIARRPIGK